MRFLVAAAHNKMSRRVIRQQAIFSLGTALLCLAPLMHAHAAGPAMQWPLCHTMTTIEQGGAKEDSRTSPTEITADYGEGIGKRLYTVRGDVFMRRGDQELEADQAVYDDETGLVDAAGGVHFRQGGFVIDGETAHFNLATETGEIDKTRYQYAQRHAPGEAAPLLRERGHYPALSRDLHHLRPRQGRLATPRPPRHARSEQGRRRRARRHRALQGRATARSALHQFSAQRRTLGWRVAAHHRL